MDQLRRFLLVTFAVAVCGLVVAMLLIIAALLIQTYQSGNTVMFLFSCTIGLLFIAAICGGALGFLGDVRAQRSQEPR